MNKLKSIVLSLMIALAMGSVSTTTFAEPSDGRITFAPADAIDLVLGKIKVALDGIGSGLQEEVLAAAVKEALDASKEINANDRVDMARTRANGKLKSARTHIKAAEFKEAEQDLLEAKKGFEDLKSML